MTDDKHREFNRRLDRHQDGVWLLMKLISDQIYTRGCDHDKSKFSSEEYEGFVKLFSADSDMDVRSKRYQDIVTSAKTTCIQAHYKNNRHHPEHFENVEDMTLLDLIEMVCDWKSASKSRRHKGSFEENLAYLKERKGLTERQCYVIDLIVSWIDHGGGNDD